MTELTPRQADILAWIEHYIERNRYSPSVRDVAEYFGMTAKGMYDHLKALRKKKRLTWRLGIARTFQIISKDV